MSIDFDTLSIIDDLDLFYAYPWDRVEGISGWLGKKVLRSEKEEGEGDYLYGP